MSQVSWTHALRQIVINCYKFHGRDDLLPTFTEEEEPTEAAQNKKAGGPAHLLNAATVVSIHGVRAGGLERKSARNNLWALKTNFFVRPIKEKPAYYSLPSYIVIMAGSTSLTRLTPLSYR